MDLGMARAVLDKVKEKDHVGMVSNPPLSYNEIAGFLGRADAFVGMRTHSLILASSMHTPLSGIIAYPKNRGYLESIDRGDGMLEFKDFTAESLWNLVKSTYDDRVALKERLIHSVERERKRAGDCGKHLAPWLDPEHAGA